MNKIKSKISVIVLLIGISALTGCGSAESVPTDTPLPESPSPVVAENIIDVNDDNTTSIPTEFPTEQDTNIQIIETESEISEETYIGNKNSKKFHRQDCNTLPAEKNRVYFNSRDEAVETGFTACSRCNP